MIICNEINEYLCYYENNKVEFNIERVQLIENIIKPLLKRNDIFFDIDTFNNCIKYCENNYYPLFPYQKFIYAFVFMYINDTPIFGTIFIEMGRGNGKDGFIMPLVNFLQTPLYNVKNYNIDIVANCESQSNDSFDVVYDMIDGNNKFKRKFYCSKTKIKNIETNSALRFNTSNAKTKDGKKGGLILFNEYHAYETSAQIDVFTSQRGKIRHPRTIIITTNGYVRGGPLDEIESVCSQILKTGENHLGYFPFICKLDNIKEIDDKSMWIKANPSLDFLPILKTEINQAYEEMLVFPSKRAEFVTKRMNLPERNEECTVASWKKILRTSYENEDKLPRKTPNLIGEKAIIGIDYADIRDFASAGLLFKIDGEYIWRQHTWICKNSPFFNSIKFPFKNKGQEEFDDFEIVDENSLSISSIVEWCMEMMQIYQVQKIVMDTYRFSLFRESFVANGLEIEDYKKNPYGLIRMIRYSNSIYTLTAPVIEKAFADETINFGPSSIMRWYSNNTQIKTENNGNKTFQKIEPKLRKNDGFMAFVVAISCEKLLDEVIFYV